MLPTRVADNLELLKALVADDARAEARFRPTPYWRTYADRITAEIEHAGLGGFRQNQKILKGFGSGGVLRPTVPSNPLKRLIWNALVSTPGVSHIVGEYDRLLRIQQKQLRTVQISLARQLLDTIAARHPQLQIPDGLTNGEADDAFVWRGKDVSANFLVYLSRLSDFYQTVPHEQVSWIIEIGPGLGLSTLAHVALNPGLRGVVNADIVPVIYVSTQFLKSSSSIEVIDYLAVRDGKQVMVEPGSRPRVYSLPAWMLPRVTGSFDFGFNAFSFQEMEPEVCAAYAGDLTQRLRKGMFLHSSIEGHKPGAGGQKSPVTMDFLKSQFRGKFARERQVDGLFCEAYGSCPECCILLTA